MGKSRRTRPVKTGLKDMELILSQLCEREHILR